MLEAVRGGDSSISESGGKTKKRDWVGGGGGGGGRRGKEKAGWFVRKGKHGKGKKEKKKTNKRSL